MSLREEAVEAMAEASSVDRNLSAKVNAELWGRMSAQMREKTLERTERALDALLDFLGAHTEEWEVQAALTGTDFITNTDRVAALRGTTE